MEAVAAARREVLGFLLERAKEKETVVETGGALFTPVTRGGVNRWLPTYHPLTRGRELVELQSGPKRVADKISRKAGAGRIRPLGRLCLGLQNVHG